MIMVGLPASLAIASENQALKLRTHLRKNCGIEVPIHYNVSLPDGEVESMITGYAWISPQVYNKIEDYHKFRDAINQLVCDGFSCAVLPD